MHSRDSAAGPALRALALVLALLLLPATGGWAAETLAAEPAPVLPEQLTETEVRDLVSRLSDDDVRALLIDQLDKVAQAQAASGDGASETSLDDSLAALYRRSTLMAEALPEVVELGGFVIGKITADQPSGYIWSVLAFMAAIFIGAAVVEWLFRRLFRRLRGTKFSSEFRGSLDQFCVAMLDLLTNLVAIGVFALAAVVIFFALYDRHEPTNAAITAIFWGVILIRVITAVTRTLLSPDDPARRLLPLADGTARVAFHRIVAIASMIVVVLKLFDLLRQYQLPEGPMLAVVMTLSLAVMLAIIAIVWRDRETVAAAILPDDAGPASRAREVLAANWHILASCYFLGLWLLAVVTGLLTGESQRLAFMVSFCLLPGLPLVDWLARRGIQRLCGASASEPDEGATPEAAAESGTEPEQAPKAPQGTAGEAFEPVLVRNMRVILGLLVVVLMANVWGFDLHDVAAASMSQRVADALFEIVVTVILAWAIWGFVKTAITYYAPQEAIDVEQMVEGEAGGTGLTRAQTLLPLLRKFILVTLVVIVTLVVLSSLGVSIGPLIAGAGVVGLAIGFGAQTLVRDVISGAFFLADDAFRIGEYIDVGIAKGMVERISVRSFRLRHHNGPINTIPFGEVQKVMNYSRDWVLMKLEMRVPSDTNLEKLRKVVKKVGQQLMEDPDFGPNLLQPVKSQGVNRMDDDGAFVIRVKFMCKPGEQFVLRREVFRRVQEAFAENGIRFAPKRVMVDSGAEEPEQQVALAAVAAERPAGAKVQSDAR